MALDVSKEGDYLVSAGLDKCIKVIDLAALQVVRTLNEIHKGIENFLGFVSLFFIGAIYCLQISPDQKHVISASSDNSIRVLNASDFENVYLFKNIHSGKYLQGSNSTLIIGINRRR